MSKISTKNILKKIFKSKNQTTNKKKVVKKKTTKPKISKTKKTIKKINKNDCLIKFLNDSAWLCMEKLKQTLF